MGANTTQKGTHQEEKKASEIEVPSHPGTSTPGKVVVNGRHSSVVSSDKDNSRLVVISRDIDRSRRTPSPGNSWVAVRAAWMNSDDRFSRRDSQTKSMSGASSLNETDAPGTEEVPEPREDAEDEATRIFSRTSDSTNAKPKHIGEGLHNAGVYDGSPVEKESVAMEKGGRAKSKKKTTKADSSVQTGGNTSSSTLSNNDTSAVTYTTSTSANDGANDTPRQSRQFNASRDARKGSRLKFGTDPYMKDTKFNKFFSFGKIRWGKSRPKKKSEIEPIKPIKENESDITSSITNSKIINGSSTRNSEIKYKTPTYVDYNTKARIEQVNNKSRNSKESENVKLEKINNNEILIKGKQRVAYNGNVYSKDDSNKYVPRKSDSNKIKTLNKLSKR